MYQSAVKPLTHLSYPITASDEQWKVLRIRRAARLTIPEYQYIIYSIGIMVFL